MPWDGQHRRMMIARQHLKEHETGICLLSKTNACITTST
jgi:hypothetical protein